MQLDTEKYTRSYRFKRRWHQVVTCLAAVVVFCITYALILPAVTMENQCNLPEHTHTDECYTQVTQVEKLAPVCSAVTLGIHRHTGGCYDGSGNPVCGYADFVVHYHDADCRDENGTLWCPLPQISTHTHGEACYLFPETQPVHVHTEECVTLEQGALICTESTEPRHVHTEDCYSETATLVCEIAESQGHTHGEACYDEAGSLICGLEESQGHIHGEGCYATVRELSCGQSEEPAHAHTDECYQWEQVLICEQSDEVPEPVEPVLICEKREIILHTHTESCFDGNRNLVCGKTQVLAHQHTNACFGMIAVPLDTQTLTCTNTEEDHVHGPRCYGTWELTCGQQEHAHTEECTLHREPEEPEEPEATYLCGKTEHTHEESCYDETGAFVCQLEEHTHTEECTKAQEPEEPEESELPGWTAPSGLPVMGTVYAVPGPMQEYAVMLLDADSTDITDTTDTTDTTETTDPLSVESYITDATLYYRTDENAAWVDVTGATDIPGNADFRLEIDYGNVSIDDLLAAGGKMTYTLPKLLRNATANGSITSGTTVVGTITVADGIVTLAFDTTWVAEQKTEDNTVIKGDFFVEAEVDLSQVKDDQPGQIVIGNTKININFEGDIVAKYGNVDLAKTVSAISEEEDGDYLTYTLKVTAGVDGCPEVKVVDAFADTQYIEEYVGVTGVSTATNGSDGPTETGGTGSVYIGGAPTEETPIPEPAGENPTKPGTLVWVIGDMEVNETRTLTYRVKLKDEYTGVTVKGNLQNTANVYSKTYQRDSDTVTFTPKAEATMSKVASIFTPGENGGGTITYTVWVKAEEYNSYILDNVKIVDALDGSIDGKNSTPSAIRQYLSYDKDSFHLYKGGSKDQNGSNGLTEITSGTKLTITDTDNDEKYNDSFTYYVGPLAPGESKTLTYTVNVEPGVFMAAGNADVQINNRACIYTDDTREDGFVWLNGYNTGKTINRKAWSRKLVGEKQETETTVEMSGSVYDATGSSVTQITSPDTSFIVPVRSYKYQVVANEAGDWDLSSASMRDSLGSQHMQFVGYVRVDAYTISENAPGSGLGDADAIANLSGRTPDQTVWVKVDRKTSFSFTPKDIGLSGTQAYLMTYYAQPVDIDDITQVVVSNRFNLSGTVGIGNIRYVLTGIGVEASVIVEGDNSFAAEKQSWYYEAPKVDTGDFANGSLYWVIKVDGKLLPAGTAIKDVTNAAGGSTHHIRGASFVGAYTASFGTTSLTDYTDLDSLMASNQLSALGEDVYTITKDNNSLTLTLSKELKLGNGTSLYIILKTEPGVVPSTKRDAFTFNNSLQSSSGSTNWVDHNVASKTLYGSENIFKELGRVFTYSGSGDSITDIQHGKDQQVNTGALDGAGTYVAWQIHVNYEGSLSGRYRVIEQIPDGMEVTYVRLWWLGPKAVKQSSRPAFARIYDLAGWTEYAKNLPSNNAGSQTNYYYTNGQQVIWDIDNLVAGGGTRDDYAVEIQIVCKVTDPDVLLGGATKEFNNVVSLQNSDGAIIGTDSNGVSIGKQSLSKQGTYNPETNGGRYPFQITLNELGEDLVSGADTITLVDDLSSTLILDTTSIQVVNTKTGEPVTDWTASVEGQTLKIVLPDNLPLTVTYEATVNAAPGQTISISNNAHWEGYTTPSGGSVEVKEFQYATGGTAGADTSPSVTVKKLDQYNTSLALPGAEFTLVEGTYAEDGTFTPTENGLSLTGITGEDGTLTFGRETGQTMKYNMVYCLTETAAPEGYVLDAAPHYFAVAKQNDDKTYPTFPAGVTVWYQSANYAYQAYNHKGEATVAKTFLVAEGGDQSVVDGTYRFGIYADQYPTGAPLQTVSITFPGSTTGTVKFTNLTLGATYYIYELDDSGSPIQGGAMAKVNGTYFVVSYTGGPAVTIPSDGTASVTVTVTNDARCYELPETGGMGTAPYTAGGLAMLLGAAMVYTGKKRRKENS